MSVFKIIPFLILLLLVGCEESDQTSSKSDVIRVGILSGLDIFEPVLSGFTDRMKDIGYEEGVNVEYLVGHAKGDGEKMGEIARMFVEKEMDLILTTTNQGAMITKKVTAGTSIPVIFTIVMAPVDSGIVDSLTNPSGNMTGVRNPLGEFIGKRLEIMKELSTTAKKILVLHDPDYPTAKYALKGLRAATKGLGVSIEEVVVRQPVDVINYFDKITEPDFEAILIMPDITVQNPKSLEKTFSFAAKHGVPVIANTPKQVEQGALFSYLTDSYDAGRAAAQLANKALGGKYVRAHPVISVEPRLVLNLGIARKLGLKIDDGLLSLSHRTIE